jgi:hypothetical protein
MARAARMLRAPSDLAAVGVASVTADRDRLFFMLFADS